MLMSVWIGIALVAAFAIVACDAAENDGNIRKANSNVGVLEDVVVLAKLVIGQLQEDSFKKNVEYCGYITASPDGELKIVGPEKGTVFGCRKPLVYKPDKIVASYHTHGAIDPRVITEIPSSRDFDAVASERVDAFIGTHGGRFWHVDFESSAARLLCGPTNCLPQQADVSDPAIVHLTILDRHQAMMKEEMSGKTNGR